MFLRRKHLHQSKEPNERSKRLIVLISPIVKSIKLHTVSPNKLAPLFLFNYYSHIIIKGFDKHH